MKALAQILHEKPQFLRLPTEHMNALFVEGGMALVPLGGSDGKSPLVRFQGRNRLPLKIVLDRMKAANSSTYGIRLHGLTVVDVDIDDAANRAYVKKRFGHSPLTVQTPRGLHYYFRGESPNLAIKKDNIAIDVKSGGSSYVCGAGSIRPNGEKYKILSGDYSNIKWLPKFKDAFVHEKSIAVGKVPIGQRFTEFLFPKAIEFAPACDSYEALVDELQSQVNFQCEEPETVFEHEIHKAAKWAWEKRASNSLYAGENSAVKTTKLEFQMLQKVRYGELGLFLLHTLRHNHAGSKRIGKPFPICRRAMAKANIIDGWTEDKYRRASTALLNAGLIKLAKRAGRNRGANLYQFNSLIGRSKGGEGFKLLMGDISPQQISQEKH